VLRGLAAAVRCRRDVTPTRAVAGSAAAPGL
jgi:hypothetical protein